MKNHFEKIKSYLLDLDFIITHEDKTDGIIVIQKEQEGISNLIIGVADPLLIMEQFLFTLPESSTGIFRKLLQKNRDIVHGAFVLDHTGTKVIFRDTLQLENLDSNELEGSINSLSLLLSEYSQQIIDFSKQ